MIKIFRRIRKQLLAESKFSPPERRSRAGKYLLYAIGEIILVVIGILIALQINNWNGRRLQKEDERKSYLTIKNQVSDDRKELVSVKAFNKYYSAAYEFGNRIITEQDRSKVDSLAMVAMALSQYSDFHRSGNIYETLVNSGDIKLLKNTVIPSKMQQLEMTYNFANKLEDIHWEIIINELSPELRGIINYSNMKPVKPEKLYSVEIQNIFMESIYLTRAKDTVYTKAIREIDTIISLIENELSTR